MPATHLVYQDPVGWCQAPGSTGINLSYLPGPIQVYSSPSLRCRWVWEPQGALGEDLEGPGQVGRLRKDLGRIQWTHDGIAEEV